MRAQIVKAEPTEIVKVDPTLSQIVENFINSQDVKPSSKALYTRTLKQYFNWITKEDIDLSQVTRIELLQYKQDLLDNGLSPLTVGSYITVVRKFYEYAEANKIYPNVAKGIKTPRRKQQFKKQALTIDLGSELLNHFEHKAKRDYAIVNLLIRTGLRTIEVSRANIEDITFKSGKRILLVHGKGRDEKDNFVVLTDKAYQPIKEYLETRPNAKGGDPLFISTSNNSKGETLTTRSISGVVKEGMRAIGLDSKEFTAHSLRHTTAVNILRAGGRIEDAQGVLRHSSPSTTQIYTETIREELRIKNSAEELIDSLM
jgi:integrase/recombinase XerC/integrase/recombinase XerD